MSRDSLTTSLGQPVPPPRARGFALVVALVLLVALTLTAFAGLRGTLLQQKMAAHQQDRQIAFQHAEAALRVAQLHVAVQPDDVARDCQMKAVSCLANPFNDPGLPRGSIRTVENSEFAASPEASGPPQYVIENMGDGDDSMLDAVVEQSASAHNYGGHVGAARTYYRITARSADPAISDGRVLVVLQATVVLRR
nr:PilX N-terminal domain-containing pilus assembly protein [Dyella sp. ASV24]